MRMAQRVIAHFSNDRDRITSRYVKKPLNEFFQEMIEGTATEDDIDSIVRAG